MSAAPHASAEEKTVPTKETLLSAWEFSQKSQPTTVIFEKTDEPGVYNFETTLFPYKGRLKVLNILLQDHIEYYYDYDVEEDSSAMGIVEVKLLDAPKDFFDGMAVSQSIWNKQHTLYFISGPQRWMTKAEWEIYDANKPETLSGGACRPTSSSATAYTKYKGEIFLFSSLMLLGLFLVFVGRRTIKFQNSHVKKFDLSMERQLEALQISEKMLKQQDESLEIQRKQAAILEKLLQKTEK
ncbi:MAG: hypothetical protein R3D66_04120 [Alphaproteobacteria bacterium]